MRLTEIFPTIPQVKRLLVCEPKFENIDTVIWLRALQGLVNRDEPHMYIAPAGARIHG